jgi:hypothetical protein
LRVSLSRKEWDQKKSTQSSSYECFGLIWLD